MFALETNLNDSEIKELLDLLFFLKKMSFAEVKMDDNEFMLSYPEYHTHLNLRQPNVLQETRNFILAVDEYNKKHVKTYSHEELQEKNLKTHEVLFQKVNENKSVTITSKKQIEEYQDKIKTIEEDYERFGENKTS